MLLYLAIFGIKLFYVFFLSQKSQCSGVSQFGGNDNLRNARLSVSLCFYSVEILRPTSGITSALGVHG